MQRILDFDDGHSLNVKLAPDWHQAIPETKKSAGVNLLTLDLLGSPTRTRTWDLRINSRGLAHSLFDGNDFARYTGVQEIAPRLHHV
jgi:hypothetical protein